jgi:hypothetical protein
MRILYNNLLETASIVATNEDANYPVENVHDTTLLTEFRADTNSSTITATLASASTVSCLAFGNHNIDTLQVTLTDSGAGTTVKNYTASDLKFSDSETQAMVYFTAVTDVTEIEYVITSVTTLFIGGLSAGQCLQMPLFDINPKIGFESSGSRQKSRGGVSFNVPGVDLETFGCTFNAASITDYNAINFAVVQTYKPYYVDRYESATEFPVLFAQNTKDVSWTKGREGIIFDSFRLELEECK